MKYWKLETVGVAEGLKANRATEEFEEIITELGENAWSTMYISVPEGLPDDNRDKAVLEIVRKKAEASRMAFEICQDNENSDLMREFIEVQAEIRELGRQKAEQEIEKDYEMQKEVQIKGVAL